MPFGALLFIGTSGKAPPGYIAAQNRGILWIRTAASRRALIGDCDEDASRAGMEWMRERCRALQMHLAKRFSLGVARWTRGTFALAQAPISLRH
jgi:hypothetical protein